jgi:hypothetical protein
MYHLHLMEDADDAHVDVGGRVHVRQALVQAAHHIHVRLLLGPRRHRPRRGVRPVVVKDIAQCDDFMMSYAASSTEASLAARCSLSLFDKTTPNYPSVTVGAAAAVPASHFTHSSIARSAADTPAHWLCSCSIAGMKCSSSTNAKARATLTTVRSALQNTLGALLFGEL